ncbi:MAG: nucleotidyltransferase domain-containing protein [Sedimentisphaerales bacterium]
MVSLVEKNRNALNELCVKFRVRRLEVFGSASTGRNFDAEKSDLDFLVEFLTLQPGEYADAYFGLLDALETLFRRHIDLVMPRAVKNRYFIESISKNREVLYAA